MKVIVLDMYGVIVKQTGDDYLTKPFQPLHLKKTIYNLTERTVIDN